MGIAEKLTTIAENEQKVFNAGKLALLDESKYMHPTISGGIISVNDVSPIEHSLGVKVGSKNLIDGSTILDGYEILKSEIVPNTNWYVVSADVLPNTQYAISGFSSAARIEEDIDGNRTRPSDSGVFTTLPTTIKVYFNSNKSVYGNNQLELGSTQTTYTPYITDFSNVKVTRCGKNFFDADTVLPSFTNINFPTWHWSKQADGSFYLGNVGTLGGCKWFENTSGYKGQISISITAKSPKITSEQSGLGIYFKYTDDTSESFYVYGCEDYITKTLVSNPNKTVLHIAQSYNYGTAVYLKDIMIAYGTDTEYEPYNPYTVTANIDGTVEGLASLSPNMTLYTDNDGAIINCQYYRDIDNLIGNVVLSGGE